MAHLALALEALEVSLSPDESRQVLPLARPDAGPAERLHALAPSTGSRGERRRTPPRELAAWLRDIAEDPEDTWRSSWATACALFVARIRGLLDGIDTSRARAMADPAIDELLDAPGTPAVSVR